jgi:hypothetical protein
MGDETGILDETAILGTLQSGSRVANRRLQKQAAVRRTVQNVGVDKVGRKAEALAALHEFLRGPRPDDVSRGSMCRRPGRNSSNDESLP